MESIVIGFRSYVGKNDGQARKYITIVTKESNSGSFGYSATAFGVLESKVKNLDKLKPGSVVYLSYGCGFGNKAFVDTVEVSDESVEFIEF